MSLFILRAGEVPEWGNGFAFYFYFFGFTTFGLCFDFRPLPFNVSGNLKRELLKSNLVAPELASI